MPYDDWRICSQWRVDEEAGEWIVTHQRFNSETGLVLAGTERRVARVPTEAIARQVAEMLADDDS